MTWRGWRKRPLLLEEAVKARQQGQQVAGNVPVWCEWKEQEPELASWVGPWLLELQLELSSEK